MTDALHDEPTLMEEPSEPVLTLVGMGGRLAGLRYSGKGRELTLGRARECALVIPLSRVSRQQARVTFEGGRCWVLGLSQTSPSQLNGKTLEGGATPLADGDTLRMGDQDFTVHLGAMSAAVAKRVSREDARRPAQTLGDVPPVVLGAFLAAVVVLGLGIFLLTRKPVSRPGAVGPAHVQAPPSAPVRDAVTSSQNGPPPVDTALTLEDVVAEPSPVAGQLGKVAEPGAHVSAGGVLFEVIQPTRALARAREKYEQLKKHADNPEYADFLDAAKSAVETEEARARVPVKSTAEVMVVPGGLSRGASLKAGQEVMRVAGGARLEVDAGLVQGQGMHCRVAPRDGRGFTPFSAELLASASEAHRRVLRLSALPGAPGSPILRTLAITCAP